MTTITTQELTARLTQSFNDVKPLKQIDSSIPVNAKDARIITVLILKSAEIAIGCYSLGEDLDNCDYQRFLCVMPTKQTFTF